MRGYRAAVPATSPIDAYLAATDEPARSTLAAVRRSVRALLPEAEEVISYGVCAFRLRGETVAGFGAFARHCSYFPFSGSVLPALADRLEGYRRTKSALHFAHDSALPTEVVQLLVETRLREAFDDDGAEGAAD